MPDSGTTPQGQPVLTRFPPSTSIGDEESQAPLSTGAREGLPATYRMRAEAHYVDALASGSSAGRAQLLDPRAIECNDIIEPERLAPLVASFKAHGVLQPLLVQSRSGRYRILAGQRTLKAALAAGLRRVPCFVHDVNDETAAALAAAARLQADDTRPAARPLAGPGEAESAAVLAQSLGTLAICASLIPADAADLATATAGHLLRAELWRATCLLQGMRLVRDELPVANGPIAVRKAVDRAVEQLGAERRLRGFEIDTLIDVPDGSTVVANEGVLAAAIGSAVLAMVPVVSGTPGVRFTVRVADGPPGFVTVRVSQGAVRAAESWARQAFDDNWSARPGGAAARLLMLAVAAAARRLSGRVSVEAGPRGTSVSLSLPLGRSAA